MLGDTTGVYPLLGELPGVVGRACVGGELGVDGRRKGDARGELKDSGEGRKGALLEGTYKHVISGRYRSVVLNQLTMVFKCNRSQFLAAVKDNDRGERGYTYFLERQRTQTKQTRRR